MQLPRLIKIRQHFTGPVVENIEETIAEQLAKVRLQEKIKPGMRIAITAGSRGIANIPLIIRGVVRELKKWVRNHALYQPWEGMAGQLQKDRSRF